MQKIKFRKILLVFTLIFLISKIPYLFLQFPLFHPDAIAYFDVSKYILNGEWEKIANYRIDLPLGYPVFISILYTIYKSVTSILLAQNIIAYFSYVLLIYVVWKNYTSVTWHTLIAISLFLFGSLTFMHDFAPITESLYRSSLIIVFALFIHALNNPRKDLWIIFTLSVFIPAFIRSNGIFIYALWGIALLAVPIFKYPKKLVILSISTFVIINFLWAMVNFAVKGYFMIGDFNRTTNRIENIQSASKNQLLRKKLRMANSYFINDHLWRKALAYENTAFVYSRNLKEINTGKYKNKYQDFYGKKQQLKKMLKKHFNMEQIKRLDGWSDTYIETKGSFFYLNKFGRQFLTPIFSSIIWLLLFYYVVFISSKNLFRASLKHKESFILLSLSAMYILSNVVVILFHGRHQPRYEYPVSFIIYLVVALSPLIIHYRLKPKKIEKQ